MSFLRAFLSLFLLLLSPWRWRIFVGIPFSETIVVGLYNPSDTPLIIYSPASASGHLYQINLYTANLNFNASGAGPLVYIPRVQVVTTGSMPPNPMPVSHLIQTEGVTMTGVKPPNLGPAKNYTTFTATLAGNPPFRFGVPFPVPSPTSVVSPLPVISGKSCVIEDAPGGNSRILMVQFPDGKGACYVWRQIASGCDAAGPPDLFLQYFSG